MSLPKGEAADLIEFGSVYAGGRRESDPSTILCGGEEISVSFPSHGIKGRLRSIRSALIFRDRFLLIYDKEAGIPSQQTPYDGYNNVFAAMVRHLQKGESSRYVAIHNRLDRETSGLVVFSLQKSVNEPLGRAFRQRRIKKEYLAWVEGVPEKDSWTCDSEIRKAAGRYTEAGKGEGKKAET